MLCQKLIFIIVTTLIASNVTDIKLHLKFPDVHKLLLLILVLCVLESSPFLHLARIPAFVPKVFFFGVPIGKC